MARIYIFPTPPGRRWRTVRREAWITQLTADAALWGSVIGIALGLVLP